MKSTISIIVIIAGTAFNAFSQSPDSIQTSKVKVVNAKVMTGFIFRKESPTSTNDFLKLFPQTTLINKNTLSANAIEMYADMSYYFSASVGLHFKNKKSRPNPELNLGMIYFSQSFQGSTFDETTMTKRIDTLTSSQSGQTIYVDSVIRKHSTMNYNADYIAIDASLIYRTTSGIRTNFYGGIGMELGYSINPVTTITSYTNKGVEPDFNYAYTASFYMNEDAVSESKKNKSGYTFTAYLPMGIDFKLGKRKEFLKRTSIFYEMRPYINVKNIPELGTITRLGAKGGFGLRIKV